VSWPDRPSGTRDACFQSAHLIPVAQPLLVHGMLKEGEELMMNACVARLSLLGVLALPLLNCGSPENDVSENAAMDLAVTEPTSVTGGKVRACPAMPPSQREPCQGEGGEAGCAYESETCHCIQDHFRCTGPDVVPIQE
jgi:hypothetical protein